LGREIIKEGNSVSEAIDSACVHLGVTRDKADFEILKFPKRAFWGFKSVKAKVKVVVSDVPDDEPDKENSLLICTNVAKERDMLVNVGRAEDVTEDLVVYLRKILAFFELTEIEFKSRLTDKVYIIDVNVKGGENLPLLERNNSELIVALQHMGNVFLNKKHGGPLFPRVILNLNDHMGRREKKLTELVRNVAKVVLKTGGDSALEPMSSYERMIVHSVVTDIPGVGSRSVGVGNNRRVVIFAMSKDPEGC
jgi:spoIIIJ-associated protein